MTTHGRAKGKQWATSVPRSPDALQPNVALGGSSEDPPTLVGTLTQDDCLQQALGRERWCLSDIGEESSGSGEQPVPNPISAELPSGPRGLRSWGTGPTAPVRNPGVGEGSLPPKEIPAAPPTFTTTGPSIPTTRAAPSPAAPPAKRSRGRQDNVRQLSPDTADAFIQRALPVFTDANFGARDGAATISMHEIPQTPAPAAPSQPQPPPALHAGLTRRRALNHTLSVLLSSVVGDLLWKSIPCAFSPIILPQSIRW
ncbi:hypothetical protein C0992_013089 [Termitomyces sp. T32_za158]|nr:hypothetical protein C0992_013089 [Termitomyces sp. T32_za158]